MSTFTPIPVTGEPSTPRTHDDVAYDFNKHEDLILILSSAFLTAQTFDIGSKVIIAFGAETSRLHTQAFILVFSDSGENNFRRVCTRPTK